MENSQPKTPLYFAAAVILAGGLTIVWGLSQWNHPDYGRLATYYLISVVASRMKIKLPSIKSTALLNFLLSNFKSDSACTT